MSPLHGNDGVFGWLGARDFDGGGNGNGNFGGGGQGNFGGGGNRLFQASTNRTFQPSRQMQFNNFQFNSARSIRTSTIILAAFNAIAAFATAMGILIESYFRKKRNVRNFSLQRHGFSFVPEGEVYPLVLSFGIVVQSITFAVAQSTGLEKLFGGGCTLLSQMVLPAVFLVPYIQLVFGIEISLRAFQKDQPFAPRAKWTVSICLAIVGLLTLTTFLVANFQRAKNTCLLSLFWFVAEYAMGCFILLVVIVSTLLACAVIIFVRLHKSIKVEVTARVNSSRMVYYMALAAISTAFSVPFFFVLSFVEQSSGDPNALNLGMVAAVVANVSGLMTGGLYLFLKSSTLSTIGPGDKVGEYQKRQAKYKIRRESYDSDEDDQALRSIRKQAGLRRRDSDESFDRYEKDEERGSRRPVSSFYDNGRDPLRSNTVYPPEPMPQAPKPARVSTMSSAFNHMRMRSYALFPGSAPSVKSSVTLLPSTTYSANSTNSNEVLSNTLRPPPSMRTLATGRHRRDSSLVSTATVQIGLRFSSMDDIPPVAQSKVVVNDSKVHTLDCPLLREKDTDSPRPTALISPGPAPAEKDTLVIKKDPVKAAKMKTLPPVPNPGNIFVLDLNAVAATSPEDTDSESDEEPPAPKPGKVFVRDLTATSSEYSDTESDDEPPVLTLKPQVYAPPSPTKNKLPSPKGVGFTMVSKSNSTGSTTTKAKPAAGATKGDWI